MVKNTIKKGTRRRRMNSAAGQRISARFQMPKGSDIDYKNISLLQKYVNDRGKIVPRRVSGITASEQRQLSRAVKRARFLALLPTGGVR